MVKSFASAHSVVGAANKFVLVIHVAEPLSLGTSLSVATWISTALSNWDVTLRDLLELVCLSAQHHEFLKHLWDYFTWPDQHDHRWGIVLHLQDVCKILVVFSYLVQSWLAQVIVVRGVFVLPIIVSSKAQLHFFYFLVCIMILYQIIWFKFMIFDLYEIVSYQNSDLSD